MSYSENTSRSLTSSRRSLPALMGADLKAALQSKLARAPPAWATRVRIIERGAVSPPSKAPPIPLAPNRNASSDSLAFPSKSFPKQEPIPYPAPLTPYIATPQGNRPIRFARMNPLHANFR